MTSILIAILFLIVLGLLFWWMWRLDSRELEPRSGQVFAVRNYGLRNTLEHMQPCSGAYAHTTRNLARGFTDAELEATNYLVREESLHEPMIAFNLKILLSKCLGLLFLTRNQ